MEEMRKKILVEKLNGRNHLGEQEKNRMWRFGLDSASLQYYPVANFLEHNNDLF
jgi:hypothetical protein